MTSRFGSSSTIRIRGAETPYGPGPPSMAGGYRRVSGLRRAGSRRSTSRHAVRSGVAGPRRPSRFAHVVGVAASSAAVAGRASTGTGRAAASRRRGSPLEPPLDGDVAAASRSRAAGATQELGRAAGCDEARDAGRGRLVERQRAAQQRAPGQVDGHPLRDAVQLGRQGLRGRRDEQRVRQAALAAGRAARRDASAMASATASMPITSRRRVGGRRGEDEPAVAGAEVPITPAYAAARVAS